MRVLLKLSGEALGGEKKTGFDNKTLQDISERIKELVENNIQVGIVIGAGNFARGGELSSIDRTVGDNIGMLAITMNGLMLKEYLEKNSIKVFLLNSVGIDGVVDRFNKQVAVQALETGKVVICAGGTGNPYFTTDTAGTLRAIELDADMLIKVTQVDGLYTKDPNKYEDAEFIKQSTYDEVLQQNLRVMDQTAFALARENNLKIKIVSFSKPGAILKAIKTDEEGTTITN